jgi:hypothetical protein
MHPEQVSLDRFKRQVEAERRHPLVAAAHQKWSAEEAEWGRACAEAIIERLELARGRSKVQLPIEVVIASGQKST